MTSTIAEASQAVRASLPALAVSDLEALVRHHNERYWDQDTPEIDDVTYDHLVETLRTRAPSSSVLLELGPSKTSTGRGFAEVQQGFRAGQLLRGHGEQQSGGERNVTHADVPCWAADV